MAPTCGPDSLGPALRQETAVFPPQPRLPLCSSHMFSDLAHHSRFQPVGLVPTSFKACMSQGEAPALICTSRMAPVNPPMPGLSPSSGVNSALVSFSCSIAERCGFTLASLVSALARLATCNPFGSILVGCALARSIDSILVASAFRSEIGPLAGESSADSTRPLASGFTAEGSARAGSQEAQI